MAFGLGATAVAVAAFAAVYKGIEAAFGDRIKERFKRQPDLRLAIAHDHRVVETVVSSILPPWPFDADRIVAHEMTRLREEATAIEKFARKGPDALLRGADPFVRRPGDREYQRAREQFEEKLDDFEQALRAWLEEYGDAAEWRARTFELPLRVTSATSGVYAEDVVLTIDLPEGAEIVEEWPTVSTPPEAPAYVAPQPRSALEFSRPSYAGIGVPANPTESVPDLSLWQVRSDGRRVGRSLGNVHHDSTVEIDEPLLVRVPEAGRHTLTWTLRTKNGRRHRRGTLEVVVPVAEPRPPFARLHGLETYPDVPFFDDDGEVVREARTSDPPTEPPEVPDDGEVISRLRGAAALRDWLALGLADRPDVGIGEQSSAA